MILFIIEIVITSIIFLTLFYIFVWKPLSILSYIIKITFYKLSGGKINLFLREELIARGLHKPGEGYYTKDVEIRNKEAAAQVVDDDDFNGSITKIAIAFEDVGRSLNHYNPETWHPRFSKKRR